MNGCAVNYTSNRTAVMLRLPLPSISASIGVDTPLRMRVQLGALSDNVWYCSNSDFAITVALESLYSTTMDSMIGHYAYKQRHNVDTSGTNFTELQALVRSKYDVTNTTHTLVPATTAALISKQTIGLDLMEGIRSATRRFVVGNDAASAPWVAESTLQHVSSQYGDSYGLQYVPVANWATFNDPANWYLTISNDASFNSGSSLLRHRQVLRAIRIDAYY